MLPKLYAACANRKKYIKKVNGSFRSFFTF